MKKNKLIKAGALIALLLMTGACKKDWLDVNKDPNNPAEATVELVLPTALAYTAYTMGDQYQIIGGIFSQYWTQGPSSSQYIDIDAYNINATESDRPWSQLYSGSLNDLKYVTDQAAAKGLTNYEGIGWVMQAYVYQYLTDLYGDIPLSQALQGDKGTTSPKYDPQQQVYDSLLSMVNRGIDLIWNSTSDVVPGGDDLLFQGDMYAWWQFANTLKLKILLRQAYVRPSVAQAGIAELVANNADFLGVGQDAQINFSATQFNTNPLYSHIQGLGFVPNLIASQTSIQFLLNTNDPRIDAFYEPSAAGTHAGIVQGKGPKLPPPQDPNNYSQPNSTTISSPEFPVVFMSGAESQFLQAEAVARGWMAGDVQALYEAGIQSSFTFWGLEPDSSFMSQTDVAFPTAGSMEDKIKAIVTQKWVSMNGTQGTEAWIEFRRTGYPSFLTPSFTSSLGSGQFPQRLVYPSNELTRNPNVPKSNVSITSKVWWDVN